MKKIFFYGTELFFAGSCLISGPGEKPIPSLRQLPPTPPPERIVTISPRENFQPLPGPLSSEKILLSLKALKKALEEQGDATIQHRLDERIEAFQKN